MTSVTNRAADYTFAPCRLRLFTPIDFALGEEVNAQSAFVIAQLSRTTASMPWRYRRSMMSGSCVLKELVRPEGLEPPAYWFEASRSIQLSYGRA